MADGKYGTKKVNAEPALEYPEIVLMVRGMLQHQQLVRDALKLGLRPEHFNGASERSFYYLFAALSNLYEKYGLVSRDMLRTELQAWESGGAFVTIPEVMPFLCGDDTPEDNGFIVEAFTTAPTDEKQVKAERAHVESLLQRFVRDRVIRDGLQRELKSAATAGTPAGLGDSLDKWTRQAQAVDYLGRTITNNAVMPSFGTKIVLPPPPEVTGIPWIDNYVGGFREGDIIGVAGPYSGGKSTLLSVAAVRMAQNYYARGQNKLSVFICYEDTDAKVNHIFWSAAAHIERSLFESGERFWELMSCSTNLKDYDRHLPENKNGKIVLGERERWELAREWLNKHFLSLDFSANSVNGRGYGNGGVAEIASVLDKVRDDTGMDIGFIGIDYAGLMLNRNLALDSKTKNSEQIWRPMQQLPDELKTKVGIPLNATIMLAHQLAQGDIKNRPPYRYVDHSDCQGSKAFAENLHACMCINTRDPDTRVSTINWSKIRARVPVTQFGLIQMDPVVVDIHLVNDQYIASETSRRIVKRGEAGLVTPDPEVAANLMAKKKPKVGRGVDHFGASLIDGGE